MAKLRTLKTDSNLLLLKCDMGAGHFSQSGKSGGVVWGWGVVCVRVGRCGGKGGDRAASGKQDSRATPVAWDEYLGRREGRGAEIPMLSLPACWRPGEQ